MKLWIFLSVFVGLTSCNSDRIDPDPTESQSFVEGTFSSVLTEEDLMSISQSIETSFDLFEPDTNTYFDTNERLTNAQVLSIYKENDFRPIWLDSYLCDSALKAIENIEDLGLSPFYYEWKSLVSRREKLLDTTYTGKKEFAGFDMRMTYILIKIGNDLAYGRLDPLAYHETWNIPKIQNDISTAKVFQEGISKNDLKSYLESCAPHQEYYVNLSRHLKRYKAYAKSGGWEALAFYHPEQRKLEPGDRDPLVPEIRRRLFAEGYLDSTSQGVTDSLYDGPVLAAMKSYQTLHGLNDDGVMGKRTIASLNISAEERYWQILINLERLKWFCGNLQGDYILVNVPQYRLYAHLDNEPTWETHVIVGKNSTKTPMFTADMKYVVFNPYWTLPYSIASKETLPHLKKDSLYLEKNDMILLDYDRNEVDPTGIDWHQYTQKTFPYIVRQRPGDQNSLGRVKFLFPNDHYIYLHDTPSRNLFRTDGRSYSHGCIRVNQPMELARRILNDSIHWNADSINATLDSLKTLTVSLDRKFPVYIVYITTFSDLEGQVLFFDDNYGYDDAIRQVLHPKFRTTKD